MLLKLDLSLSSVLTGIEAQRIYFCVAFSSVSTMGTLSVVIERSPTTHSVVLTTNVDHSTCSTLVKTWGSFPIKITGNRCLATRRRSFQQPLFFIYTFLDYRESCYDNFISKCFVRKLCINADKLRQDELAFIIVLCRKVTN